MKQFVALCVLSFAVLSSGKPCGGHHRTVAQVKSAQQPVVKATRPAPVAAAPAPVVAAQAPKNIPNVATELGATTLVDLVVKAGLAGALSGPGPFTVFAPTNEAFAALPKATLDALAADKELLSNVLLYHVVSGKVESSALSNDLTAASLQGVKLRINKYDNVITADGADVIKADVPASNGVIHVINKVLYPLPAKDITAALINDPQQRFTTLVKAVGEAGLVETLQSDGPFTLFAPTNDAFNALPAGTLEGLIKDKAALTNVLLGHVVPGTIFARGVPAAAAVPVARTGSKINVKKDANGVTVNEANVIQADLLAANGVIHVINKVI